MRKTFLTLCLILSYSAQAQDYNSTFNQSMAFSKTFQNSLKKFALNMGVTGPDSDVFSELPFYLNGYNGILSSPTESLCYTDNLIKKPYNPRCQRVKGEQWEEVTVNGRIYLVPMFVDVTEFLNECQAQAMSRPDVEDDQLTLRKYSSYDDTDIDADEVDEPLDESDKSGHFKEYSSSSEVADMIKALRRNSVRCLAGEKNAHKCSGKPPRKEAEQPTGYCYKNVKIALQDSTLSKVYLNGVAAREAGGPLKAQGFKNLLDDPEYKDMTPYSAPVGAVIVYKGGDWGHIEVKTGEKEYISDYTGTKPIYDELGLPRIPIGIYIK